jgi:glycosyltransferase involved in cell wall biosynthesis
VKPGAIAPRFKQRYRDCVQPNGALRQPDHPIYLKRMEARVHQADAVTVHTTFLQQKFGGTYIPNGKDTTSFDPSLYDGLTNRRKYGLDEYKILMFPGAPRPYKGLEDILTALDILDRPDLRLVIVGGSPYDDYDKMLQQQWGRHIIQLPKLPYAEMPAVVSAADLVVVPQRDTDAAKAQFPLKLTDGMAMAKPILATAVGDIPTIVGDAGYLVAPSDSQAMAHQIAEILANPVEVQRRTARARDRCIQHYSIEAMAKALQKALFPLLSSYASYE